MNQKSLSRIYFVYLKEFSSFWGSNLPPVSIGIVAFLCGLVSVALALSDGATYEDVTRVLFYVFYIITLVASVLLSMSAFVTERKQGTLELLYTLPVTDAEMVIAKFLFNLTIMALLLLGMNIVYIWWIAETPFYMLLTGYTGLLVVSAYAISIGILASSFTESHLVSMLIALAILIIADIGGFLSGLLPGVAGEILSHIHGLNQYTPFTRGIIPLKGFLFFTTTAALFLFFTIRVLESRRWRSN